MKRGPAQHIQRHREELKGDEERDQVLRLSEQGHAQHRRQQEDLELGVARARALGRRRGVAPRERDDDGGGEDSDQRRRQAQLVQAQRPGDEVLAGAPLPDAQAGRGGECGEGERGDDQPLVPVCQHPADERDNDPGRQGDDGGGPGVVDVRGREGQFETSLIGA